MSECNHEGRAYSCDYCGTDRTAEVERLRSESAEWHLQREGRGATMSRVTHATRRGLERLRFGAPRVGTAALVRACDGIEMATDKDVDKDVAVGGASYATGLPTCPRCAVLCDEALAQSEVRR